MGISPLCNLSPNNKQIIITLIENPIINIGDDVIFIGESLKEPAC